VFSPGLDHPPPGKGEGDRDRDIGDAKGSAGVPGIGARVEVGWARLPATRPEVLPWALLASDDSSLTRRSGDTLDEDRRR
jgi:hypothetical protein